MSGKPAWRDTENARRRERRAREPDYCEKGNARCRAYYHARKHDSESPVRTGHLKRRFGISAAEYDALLAKQGGACAICRRRSKYRLCVDHCHLTGRIRGLLCYSCNLALGHLKDDQASLVAALAYLGALPRDGPGSAAQRALAVHAALPPWPTRRALLTCPPVRCDAAPDARGIGERISALYPTSDRVPDAVQRVAAQISLRNLRKLDCAAERCTADPGPPRTGCQERDARTRCLAVPVLQRSTSRCAAPGTGERSNSSNTGDDMTIDDAPPAGGKPAQPMRDALDAELARAGGDGEEHNVLQLIARRLAAKALEGDLGAIKEIFDRIDGKSVAGSAPEQTPGKVQMQWKE
jgi:Recombination endonuclease VII